MMLATFLYSQLLLLRKQLLVEGSKLKTKAIKDHYERRQIINDRHTMDVTTPAM
jgi:hypothetical protein